MNPLEHVLISVRGQNLVYRENCLSNHQSDIPLNLLDPSSSKQNFTATTNNEPLNTNTALRSLRMRPANSSIIILKNNAVKNFKDVSCKSSTHLSESPPITTTIFIPTIDVHKEINIENCYYRKEKSYKDSIYYKCKDKICNGRIVLNKGIYTLTIPHTCNSEAYEEGKISDSNKCIMKKKMIKIYFHDEYKFKERYHLKDSHYLVCATKNCSARATLKNEIITITRNHTEDCINQIKKGVVSHKSKSDGGSRKRKKSSPDKNTYEQWSLYNEPLNKPIVATLITDKAPSYGYTLKCKADSKIAVTIDTSNSTLPREPTRSPIYVLSKRGTRLLYFDRYLYTKYKEHKSKIYYRCYESKCKVRGSVMNNVFQCDPGHDHPDHQSIVTGLKPIFLPKAKDSKEKEDKGTQLPVSTSQSQETGNNCGQELLTQKNKVLLFKDNFLYIVNRTVCDKVYYKCKRPRCPSRAVKKGGKFTVSIAHNHPDDIEAYHNFMFVLTLKDILSKNGNVPKQELYYRELAKLSADIASYIKPYISICRTLQRASSTNQTSPSNPTLYPFYHLTTITTLS